MEAKDFALERMRACSEFAHSARHELMTPISALTMLLSADGLSHDSGESSLQEQSLAALQRITRLVRSCVDYVDSDLPLPSLATVDCNELIAEAEALVRQGSDAKFARATIEVRGNLPRLKGHAPSLCRVFAALLDNGIRYSQEATAQVLVAAAVDGDGWRIEFADNGIGVEESKLEAVFSPFQRQHAYDAIPGIGLSLATARRIARRHGGDLGLRNRAGSGVIAWVRLPRI